MTFVVYATYSVAIAIFVFWFGVWMLHLIAITYGKIRLHKKSRLHQKLQQHDLLHQQQRHRSSLGGGGDEERSPSNGGGGGIGKSHYDLHSANYHNLHQLMHQGPIPPANGGTITGTLSKANGGGGLGESSISLKGSGRQHNKSSSCDYSSIVRDHQRQQQQKIMTTGGSLLGAASNSRETVINLNCDDESKDLSSGGGHAIATNHIGDTQKAAANSSSSASHSPKSSQSGGGAAAANASSSSLLHTSSSSSLLMLSSSASGNSSGSGNITSSLTSSDASKVSDGGASAAAARLLLPSTDLLSADNSSVAAPLLLRKSAAEIVSRLPKVSILKPLMGIDSNLAANLETFFTMDYPRQSYEILFCVESKEDPVLGLCESLIKKYKGEVDARLFLGGELVGVNPKINNMEPGYREAKYELVMISDAGIKMKPDTLMDMVEHMTEKVALVHQMPFTCDREGFAATYEKIFFGTMQSRIYLVSDCLNVICHTGMSCLVRKKVLDGLGGLRAFGCYLAEDFFMAKAITEDGWKATISSYPALQNSGVCDVKTFHNRLVRWAKLRIAMLSWLILLEPMSECMIVGAFASWGVSILFRWDSIAFYLIHILCWFLADWMLLTIVQNGSVSFNKFDFVVGWLLRELSGPYLFFCALWNPAIRWRTRVYKLDWGGVAYELNSSTKIKT